MTSTHKEITKSGVRTPLKEGFRALLAPTRTVRVQVLDRARTADQPAPPDQARIMRHRPTDGRKGNVDVAEHVEVETESDVPVRLDSAASTLRALEDEILEWSQENTVEASVQISPHDSSIVEFYADPPEAPTHAWSLRFGHAVHDLRSALDHLAQQLCRLEGSEPIKPKQVAFPVAETEKTWKDSAKALATVPAELLSRIESIQPVRSTGSLACGLSLLNEIAIADKHYELSRLSPIVSHLDLGNIQPWPSSRADNTDWKHPIVRLTVVPPAADDSRGLRGVAAVPFMPILLLGDKAAMLVDVMRWIYAVTVAIVRHVTTGEESNDLPDDPVWL